LSGALVGASTASLGLRSEGSGVKILMTSSSYRRLATFTIRRSRIKMLLDPEPVLEGNGISGLLGIPCDHTSKGHKEDLRSYP
jgi:hypothetical protein